MRRTRLGLCIGDREYGDRFTSCLMNHYRDQLELHMFSQKEALQENWKTLDAIVLSDDLAGENRIECEIPQIYLFDGNENVDKEVEKGVVFVDKYQEVNKIVDEILKQIGEEIKNASGGVKQKLQVLAVYSLAENEMQLPFAVTLSSILSENEKVLLLDLQEGNPHCRSHNPHNNIHPRKYQLSYPQLPATVYRLPDKACLLLLPAAVPGNSGNRSYQAWKIPSLLLPSRSSYSQVAGSSYSDKDNFHCCFPQVSAVDFHPPD